MKRFLLSLACLGLVACQPPAPPDDTLAPTERTETNDLLTPPNSGTGTTIVERLLPTGLIEIGDRDAPLTLMIFTEHHCRYCKEFFYDHFPRLQQDFIDQGALRLQFSILPLKKYPNSDEAALGMICAAGQNKAIAMHELLLQLGAPSRESLFNQAASLELDQQVFSDCLASEQAKAALDQQKALARSLDVTLVPTLFLNGEKSVGLPYYADLRGMIQTVLEK